MRAIHIISDEHRTSTAVLHGILFLLRHVSYGVSEANFELLDAMISYFESSRTPASSKEDAYLFRLLRKRHPPSRRCSTDCRVSTASTPETECDRDIFGRYRREGSAHLPALYEAVATYAAFHYSHMRAEEDEVLPRRRSI